MKDSQTKTSLFLYVPVAILGILIVYFIFAENFKAGMKVGENTPPPSEPRKKAGMVVDHRALAQDASLAAKGKTLYAINCASCHGTSGQGDGQRAAGLNPPPRNYKTEKFKFGDDVVSLHNTLEKGSPGTSMPSFQLLPQEDIWAMVHFVRTLIPEPTATTEAIIAQLPESPAEGASTASSTSTIAAGETASSSGERIPIQFAMQRLAEPAQTAMSATAVNSAHPGAAIYASRCASCHGARGEGRAIDLLSVAPYAYTQTASLVNRSAAWAQNREEFAALVVNGLPGRVMPGNASLTRGQVNDLYEYVLSFAR